MYKMENIRSKIKNYLQIDNRLIRVLLAEYIGTTFLMVMNDVLILTFEFTRSF